MDSELPTLLSDAESDGSLSSREGGERQYRNQAPGLISDSSAESGYETPGPRAGQQPQQRPPSAPHLQHEPLGTRGYVVEGLDDIDHSNDEYMDDYYDDEDGVDDLLGPRWLLTGMPQQQDYMQDPLNEGLLQQIPVQNLLEALLNSGQAGLLAGGGGPFVLPGMGLAGPTGGRLPFAAGLPGVESRVPAGLEGSARRHAINMAEQGFVTALDPARHAACAAEGIPGGRHVMSPRGGTPGSPPAPRQQQQQPGVAGPAGAARQAGGLGGLQRADSAVLGGGLQRGDSAASQGMSRVARHAGGQRGAAAAGAGGAAAGARPPALSRLASTARSGAAPGQRAVSGPPALVSSGGESEQVPGLETGSSDSEYSEPPRQRQQQLQGAAAGGSHGSAGAAASHGSAVTRSSAGSNAQERDSYAEPPRRRQRRNAVFGQLPGLGGAAPGGTAAAAGSGSSGQQLWGGPGVPPLLEESDSDSQSEQSSERSAELAPHVRRQQRQARQQQQRSGSGRGAGASGGSDGSPPSLESATSADEQRQQRRQHGGPPVPIGASFGSRDRSAASSRGGGSGSASSDADDTPPALWVDDDATTVDADDFTDGGGPRLAGSGAGDSGIPGLLSDAASSESSSESEAEQPGRRRGVPAQAARAGAALPPRQRISEDQRVVMQALTSLLPAQQYAAGWAELASYVRHASGAAAGRRGSSAGGVQLLSRLVAAAASRFPAEAEAAGLTERPLAPPPSMAHSAAATAAVSPVGTPAHGVPAAAVAAAATMAAASGAAAAAAAERQRAEQQRAEQHQPVEQQRAEQQRVEWLRAEQHRVIEEASQPALVTFVAESPAAAAALQRELGDAVRVVADGQQTQEEAEVEAELARRQQSGLPALTMVVTPGRDWPPDLQMVQLPFGMTLATEEDYDAVFEEQEPLLDQQLHDAAAFQQQQQQQQQQQVPPTAASAAGASTSGLPEGGVAAAQGQAPLAATHALLVGQLAALRGQHRYIVANTEAMLRAVVTSGATTQPLPPLVAAAVAAAAPPPPHQAEE